MQIDMLKAQVIVAKAKKNYTNNFLRQSNIMLPKEIE